MEEFPRTDNVKTKQRKQRRRNTNINNLVYTKTLGKHASKPNDSRNFVQTSVDKLGQDYAFQIPHTSEQNRYVTRPLVTRLVYTQNKTDLKDTMWPTLGCPIQTVTSFNQQGKSHGTCWTSQDEVSLLKQKVTENQHVTWQCQRGIIKDEEKVNVFSVDAFPPLSTKDDCKFNKKPSKWEVLRSDSLDSGYNEDIFHTDTLNNVLIQGDSCGDHELDVFSPPNSPSKVHPHTDKASLKSTSNGSTFSDILNKDKFLFPKTFLDSDFPELKCNTKTSSVDAALLPSKHNIACNCKSCRVLVDHPAYLQGKNIKQFGNTIMNECCDDVGIIGCSFDDKSSKLNETFIDDVQTKKLGTKLDELMINDEEWNGSVKTKFEKGSKSSEPKPKMKRARNEKDNFTKIKENSSKDSTKKTFPVSSKGAKSQVISFVGGFVSSESDDDVQEFTGHYQKSKNAWLVTKPVLSKVEQDLSPEVKLENEYIKSLRRQLCRNKWSYLDDPVKPLDLNMTRWMEECRQIADSDIPKERIIFDGCIRSSPCSVCMDNPKNSTLLCGHRFCFPCADYMQKVDGGCAICRQHINLLVFTATPFLRCQTKDELYFAEASCSICEKRQQNATVVQCGHRFCSTCASIMQCENSSCIDCGQVIVGVIKAYC